VTDSLARRTIPLEGVRADGWFERVAEASPSFSQLCSIVGERFVAFSIVAGVRITALTVDPRFPDASLVDFTVGEDANEQRLALGEFRRRLASALLAEESPDEELPDEETAEALHRYLGIRHVLLAPIFGVRLKELRLRDMEPPTILIDAGDLEQELEVEDFREMMRERIRSEVARSRPASPFAIDLARVDEAEEANQNADWTKTIELLGAWPGPLSLLLRTAEGQALAPETKATLARALGLLGTAYVHSTRFDWAEEVLRLGIQWGQDGAVSADLFRRLGESYVARDRHGEAIGLLRRSLSLGAHARDVLPLLAACYVARKRYVAALVCADEAELAGATKEELAPLRAEARAVLGSEYDKFREHVPVPKPVETVVPPKEV